MALPSPACRRVYGDSAASPGPGQDAYRLLMGKHRKAMSLQGEDRTTGQLRAGRSVPGVLRDGGRAPGTIWVCKGDGSADDLDFQLTVGEGGAGEVVEADGDGGSLGVGKVPHGHAVGCGAEVLDKVAFGVGYADGCA